MSTASDGASGAQGKRPRLTSCSAAGEHRQIPNSITWRPMIRLSSVFSKIARKLTVKIYTSHKQRAGSITSTATRDSAIALDIAESLRSSQELHVWLYKSRYDMLDPAGNLAFSLGTFTGSAVLCRLHSLSDRDDDLGHQVRRFVRRASELCRGRRAIVGGAILGQPAGCWRRSRRSRRSRGRGSAGLGKRPSTG